MKSFGRVGSRPEMSWQKEKRGRLPMRMTNARHVDVEEAERNKQTSGKGGDG